MEHLYVRNADLRQKETTLKYQSTRRRASARRVRLVLNALDGAGPLTVAPLTNSSDVLSTTNTAPSRSNSLHHDARWQPKRRRKEIAERGEEKGVAKRALFFQAAAADLPRRRTNEFVGTNGRQHRFCRRRSMPALSVPRRTIQKRMLKQHHSFSSHF